ncbi:MAG: hypothetical protein KF847_21190, partial [Pirellulales bacterium]|nr:hypothetical protein [Pirellulales bacterium]
VDIGAYESSGDTTSPTILDVVLRGSSWATSRQVAFSEWAPLGWQYRPIPMAGINAISIQFNEHVLLDGSELTLEYTQRLANGGSANDTAETTYVGYDSVNHIATWTTSTPLVDGKYALRLSTNVTDLNGNPLDGDWDNGFAAHNGTPDDFTDDAPRAFIVGNSANGSMGNEFRLHFAVLAFDFNGDGHIEGSDYLMWSRQMNHDPLPGEVLADADGDGIVTGLDNPAEGGAWGNKLPFRFGDADFNDDEIVDQIDYWIWQDLWGSQFFNGDFYVWQRAYGTFSVWHASASAVANSSLPGGPQVLDVIISGMLSAHDAYSFDSAGATGSGAQLATVPVGGANTISIVFSANVNVSAGSMLLVGLGTGNFPSLVEFTYDPNTYTATWRFEGWALADHYLISLSDAITDEEGRFLDGEWTNPASITTTNSLVSTFPSGDGYQGGRFNFVMTLLPGDADRNGIVNDMDWEIWQTFWAQDGGFEEGDFLGDGIVGGEDLEIWSLLDGTNLRNLWMLADLDGDFDVDGDDLYIISQNFGSTNATWADGDLNGDGNVDENDFDLAFALFGLTVNAVG